MSKQILDSHGLMLSDEPTLNVKRYC